MNCRGGVQAPPPRVCFFGTYARQHTVSQLLDQACRAAGADVVECHRPLWEDTRRKDARYFGVRSALRLGVRYAREAITLARARRRIGAVPLYLVGFNGQLDCLLLRWLVRREHAAIVFAPLVTLSETLVEDRRVFTPRSIQARLAAWLDRASLTAATRVVIDTKAHREYLIEQFAVPPERVAVWYLGADPNVFRPLPLPRREGPLRVLFYGSFLPLHGSRTVIEAAALLGDDRRCEFILVGDGLERAACVAMVREAGLRQIHFEDWVAYERLSEIVGEADICLGIFGATAKARMVIPNKLYQAAAVGRPVITADTPAVREVFEHGQSAWLCAPDNASALADAVRTLCDDADLRSHLAHGAASLMAERFSPASQAASLAKILADAVSAA